MTLALCPAISLDICVIHLSHLLSAKRSETVMDQSLSAAQLRLQQIAAAMPVRSDLHIARKVWHACMGTMIVVIYTSGISQALALGLVAFFFTLDVSVEMLRLKNPVLNEKVLKVFGPIFRHHEVNRLSTVPYFLAATFFAIAVFPKPVTILSLLYLAWGDPAASFFGVLFKGRSIKITKNKSLHGAVAAFTVCAIITYAYLKSGGMDGLNVIRLTLLGGFAGALAESLPLK